jgi:hypothetical protein
MQVYAATLAQLAHDGAKLALIFADRRGRNLRAGAESRIVKSGQETTQQKETEGVIDYGREFRN